MIAAVSSRRAGSAGRTVSVWPPTICLSPSGVSWAITRPWSITVISSASASASSRYCVVSRIVEPSATRPRTTPHMSSRLAGSRPVVGSSRKTTARAADEAGREVEAAAHAAGVGLRRAVGGVGEVEPLEQLLRAGLASLRLRSSSAPISSRFWRPVSSSSTLAYWPVRPICSRTRPGSRGDVVARDDRGALVGLAAAWRGCAPRWSCRRRWGRARRARCPSRAARSTPSSAWVSPKRLRRPRASMA